MKQGGRDLDRLAGMEIAIRPYRPMHRLEAAASAIFSPRFRLSRIVSSTPATALVASVFLVRLAGRARGDLRRLAQTSATGDELDAGSLDHRSGTPLNPSDVTSIEGKLLAYALRRNYAQHLYYSPVK
jgi:hypothetical protein